MLPFVENAINKPASSAGTRFLFSGGGAVPVNKVVTEKHRALLLQPELLHFTRDAVRAGEKFLFHLGERVHDLA